MGFIKSQIKFVAESLGFQVLAGGHVHSELGGFFRALDRLGFKPSLIYDIGANRGSWTARALRVWPSARYRLFEPQTDLHRPLGPNVEWSERGVLDKPGEARFTITERDDSCTFDERDGGEYRTVPVTSIDAEIGDGPVPDLIKIDAEGMDLQVLRGASRALGVTEVFLVEAGVLAGIENDIASVLRFMDGAGYRLAQITDLNNGPQSRLLWVVELAFVPADSAMLSGITGY